MKNVNILRDLSSLSREELEQQVMRLSTQVDELSSKPSWYEEQYRLSRAQRFGPSSEQTAPFEQMSFFNEAESESSAFIIPENRRLMKSRLSANQSRKVTRSRSQSSFPQKQSNTGCLPKIWPVLSAEKCCMR